jgi:hypothetical protein
MKIPLPGFLKNGVGDDRPLHPVESKMARHFIKRRLAHLFPELRNDPRALEEAYQALDLEPRQGDGVNEPAAYYELRCMLF